MHEIVHVVGKVNDLPDILKALFLLQGSVELRKLCGVKLGKSRRKEVKAVNVGSAYHVIRKRNVSVLVIGIPANEKILRVVCGNIDAFHGFV